MPIPGGDHIVTIKLPPRSTWTSGLHWHEFHTEFLSILQGTALVTLGSSTKTYDPGDGPIRVDRFTVHEWRRLPPAEDPDAGVELIVQEWTDPADGEKELFFRNLNSVILDAMTSKPSLLQWMPTGLWIDWQVMVICHGYDNYPVFVGTGTLRGLVTHAWLFLVAIVGRFYGLRASYDEYMLRNEQAQYKGK